MNKYEDIKQISRIYTLKELRKERSYYTQLIQTYTDRIRQYKAIIREIDLEVENYGKSG